MLVGIYSIITLTRSIRDLLGREERVEKAKEALEQEKKRHEELTLKKDYVATPEFVEKEAREKLLFGKPGESRVLIEEALLAAVSGTSSAEVLEDTRTNWQKWWAKLFGY